MLGMLVPKAAFSIGKSRSAADHLTAVPAMHLRADLICQRYSYELSVNPLSHFLLSAEGAALINDWGMEHWSAYQTTWEVDDGNLYLVDVFGFDMRDYSQLSIARLFPQADKAGRVYARWFCGELFCSYGDHWTYGPLYTAPEQGHIDWIRVKHEFERRIHLKNGVVYSDETIRNSRPPKAEERYEIPDFLNRPSRA